MGIDTESFEIALKNTLRQAPDVILIGEVRSRETMDNDLRLMIKLSSETDTNYLSHAADSLSIQPDESNNRGRMF